MTQSVESNTEAPSAAYQHLVDLDEGKRRLYQITEEILGKGKTSSVVKGQDLRSRSPVAIKCLTNPAVAEIESTVFKTVRAPHAVHYRDAFQGSPPRERSEQKHYIVMDLVPEDNIYNAFLNPNKPERLTVDEVISIVSQLLEFFDGLHGQEIGFFDLKLDNLIFRRKCRSLIVIDFGGARKIVVPFPTLPPARPHTTPQYRAPERILGGKMTTQYDLWSFGCLLFELLTGRRLFPIPQDISRDDSNHYVMQMIVQRLGKPTREFLKECREAVGFFDENLELCKKFNAPLLPPWEAVLAQSCLSKGYPLEEIHLFIQLIGYVLRYENRPSAKELLGCPLFQREKVLHLSYERNKKCKMFLHRASLISKPLESLSLSDIPNMDLTIDFNQLVDPCLHLLRDLKDEYVLILEQDGVLQCSRLILKEKNFDIRPFQEDLERHLTKSKRSKEESIVPVALKKTKGTPLSEDAKTQ
jgi:serine/threonine protein kinase